MRIINGKATPWDMLFSHIGIPQDHPGYVAWAKYLLHYDSAELHMAQVYNSVYLSISSTGRTHMCFELFLRTETLALTRAILMRGRLGSLCGTFMN